MINSNLLADLINGKELFSGVAASPILSDDYANYDILFIQFRIPSTGIFQTEVVLTNNASFGVVMGYNNDYYSRFGYQHAYYTMSGKNITKSAGFIHLLNNSGGGVNYLKIDGSDIMITKVIGYKKL